MPSDNAVNRLEADPALAFRYLELLDRTNDWFARTYWQNTATFLAVSFGAPLVLFRDTGLSPEFHRWFVVGVTSLAAVVNVCLLYMLWRLGRQMDAIVEEKRYAEALIPGVNLSARFGAIRGLRSRYLMYFLAFSFALAYTALGVLAACGVVSLNPPTAPSP